MHREWPLFVLRHRLRLRAHGQTPPRRRHEGDGDALAGGGAALRACPEIGQALSACVSERRGAPRRRRWEWGWFVDDVEVVLEAP